MPSAQPSDGSSSRSTERLPKKTKVWVRTFKEKTILGPGGIHSRKRLQVGPDIVYPFEEGESELPTIPPGDRYSIGYWSRLVAAYKKYVLGEVDEVSR